MHKQQGIPLLILTRAALQSIWYNNGCKCHAATRLHVSAFRKRASIHLRNRQEDVAAMLEAGFNVVPGAHEKQKSLVLFGLLRLGKEDVHGT